MSSVSLHSSEPLPVLVNRDEEHLRLLGLYHFVVAGFKLLALLVFIFLPLLLGPAYLNSIRMPPVPPNRLMVALLIGGLVTLIYAMNGWSLRTQRNWISCILMSVFECLNIPVGMILGVSAILVLRRNSVKALFKRHLQPQSSR